MDLRKTADKIIKKDDEVARALPTETKQTFWEAFHDDGKSLGEARELAGIPIEVAVALVTQCYKQICIPMEVEEIE